MRGLPRVGHRNHEGRRVDGARVVGHGMQREFTAAACAATKADMLSARRELTRSSRMANVRASIGTNSCAILPGADSATTNGPD